MKKIDNKKIEDGITEVLRRYFENLTINAVHVALDRDRDGEEILRVQVVFDGLLREADARRVPGVARQLRPFLEANDADLFPLLFFVSKVDYDRGHEKRVRH